MASAAKALSPTLCSLGVAALLGATLCCAVAPAGANPIASLKEQAAALSQQMLFEQLQIDGFEQQHASDMTDVAVDDAQLKQLQTQLVVTRHRIGEDLSDLRSAAITAYVEGGTEVDGMSALFAGSPTEGATSVYAEVITGDLTSAVARLQSDRRVLHSEETAQQRVAADAQRELSGAGAALSSAESTGVALSQQRAGVTGALAVAIAQQDVQEQQQALQQEQAQEQAQAHDAVMQAAEAPARPNGLRVTTQATATGVLPPLNSFLSCVIQAESSGDYQAVSPTGQYMGAFQFSQPTWNEAAQLAGIPTLAGSLPYEASPRDQDLLAIALYNADGEQPWYDPCTS